MSHPINPRYLAAGKRDADQMMHAAFGRPEDPAETEQWEQQKLPRRTTPPDIPAIVTVEPGQRILLVFKHMVSAEQARVRIGSLRAKYPDLDIDALGGVDGVIILPPTDEVGS